MDLKKVLVVFIVVVVAGVGFTVSRRATVQSGISER